MQPLPQQHIGLLSVTPAAIKRIQELITEEANNKLRLRIYITGGGCAGFQYGFAFDEQARPDDCIIEKTVRDEQEEGGEDGQGNLGAPKVSVIVDPVSIMYLSGAEIDYIENLQGAHFTVKNPNAQTTCSCGSSFSI